MVITVDLDWPSKLEIVQTWHYCENNDPGHTVQGRVSARGHGVHIRSREIYPHPVPTREHDRRMAGDDLTRLERDRENDLEPNQVLWSYKAGDRPGEWTTELDRLIQRYGSSATLTPNQHRVRHGGKY